MLKKQEPIVKVGIYCKKIKASMANDLVLNHTAANILIPIVTANATIEKSTKSKWKVTYSVRKTKF